MYKIEVLISNGVVCHSQIYEVKDKEEEELLIQSLSIDTERDGLFIDDVLYPPKDELAELIKKKLKKTKKEKNEIQGNQKIKKG